MKREKGWLTSKTFAALCGTTKETLWHYKNAGLLLRWRHKYASRG